MIAVAGLVFCVALISMLGLSAYAIWYRIRGQHMSLENDGLHLKRKAGRIPSYEWVKSSTAHQNDDTRTSIATVPWRSIQAKDSLERPHVHDDEDYLIKFGWLSARFRRSKWWFFSAWLVYEFVRACFYGGAAGNPLIQVFGLLAWEIISLFAIVLLKPFESNRLNMLMIYFLGFSKVVSVALCSAFDPRFGLGRILTVVIGIIIIVIQGILIICMLVAIVIGCFSSWMSLRRYNDNFKPEGLVNARTRYFAHIEQKATDKPLPKVKSTPEVTDEMKEPYFNVTTVRRQTKIEDDDVENENNFVDDDAATNVEDHRNSTNFGSRAASIRSRTSATNLPYGARRHRASWSQRDFSGVYEPEQVHSGVQSRMSLDSMQDEGKSATVTPMRKRASSVRHSWTNDPSLIDVANAALEQPPNAYRSRHMRSKTLSQTQLQNRYSEHEEEDHDASQNRSH